MASLLTGQSCLLHTLSPVMCVHTHTPAIPKPVPCFQIAKLNWQWRWHERVQILELMLTRCRLSFLPTQGPVGELLNHLRRHNMRPNHLHMMFDKSGFRRLTTALYPEGDPYNFSDAVFGVKRSLVIVSFSCNLLSNEEI